MDEIDNDSEENKSRSNNKKKQKNNNEETLQPSLEFTPFQYTHYLHNLNIVLPDFFQSENPTSYIIFSEFFSQNQIKLIVQNTNIYAYYQNAIKSNLFENGYT